MDSQNRINPTAVTPTVGRQTPKDEFGGVLANALGTVASVGGALVSGLTNGMPVVSAAVSSVKAMTSATASAAAASAGGVVSVGGKAPSTVAASDKGESYQILELQKQQSNEYLQLQMAMQAESREYNAVSNILKVRHDSAKAAINNIR